MKDIIMTKEQKEYGVFDTLEYGEKASTSVLFGIIGIVLIIASFFTLFINEIISAASDEGQMLFRPWIYRSIGFVLMYLGLKWTTSIFSFMTELFPLMKKSFVFLNDVILLMMTIIISLFIAGIVWMFSIPLLGLSMIIVAIITWSYMRKIKASRKQKLMKEFEASGEKAFDEFGRIIEGTFTDIEKKSTKIKNLGRKKID